MAQINLPHTLVAGTPENINDVQDNFQQVVDHFNNALVGDDNLTSPNNGVPRTVFQVGGSFVPGGTTAATYVMRVGTAIALAAADNQQAPDWNPVAADFAVAGKTAQVRLVAQQKVNNTAPGVTFTVGLQGLTGVAGGSGVLTLTLQAASMTAVITTPGAQTAGPRIASSWVNLAALSSNASHVLTVAVSGTTAAASVVSLSAAIEMRHV